MLETIIDIDIQILFIKGRYTMTKVDLYWNIEKSIFFFFTLFSLKFFLEQYTHDCISKT